VLSDRYRIDRTIGEGGMGAVYQAEHLHMHKRLAVKVLHPEMSRLPEIVARFEREAMAAGHIDHPNVATASDFGKLPDGSFFLVLEYLEGKSLRDVIREGPLPIERALHITRQIASALERAHTLGIVHRDLKPEDVMVLERGGDRSFVKVLDFGIAKVPVEALGAPPSKAEGQTSAKALTQLGAIFGTPDYMAPEQTKGEGVDGRADLYALGIVLFEMLTGRVPFVSESPIVVLAMHVTAPVPSFASVGHPEVPAAVESLVGRLLSKDPRGRYADAAELLVAIDAIARPVAPAALAPRPPSRVSPGVVVAVGALLGLFMLVLLIAGAAAHRHQAPVETASTTSSPAETPPPEVSSSAPELLHLDRERAAMASGDTGGALAEARLAINVEPAALTDAKLATDLRTIALGGQDVDAALTLLERMGAVGSDAIYDLAYGYSAGPATAPAKKALLLESVTKDASPALAVTLELRNAQGCERKKALFDRAASVGDVRTLAVLHEYESKVGCGRFFKKKDCWPCMRKEDALGTTMAAIAARANQK
jgi:serine/threonine protein kinase